MYVHFGPQAPTAPRQSSPSLETSGARRKFLALAPFSLYPPHPMLLKDQVALITGSGRGIGRAIARLFACEGASVFLTARTQSELASTTAEINKFAKAALANLLISAVVDASSLEVRAVRKTEAPSEAKSRAMARPMPRPEPVISATWSFSNIG